MRTQLLGELDVDEQKIAAELQESTSLGFTEQYTEFSCGRPWRSSMLWAPGGELGDGILTHYNTSVPAVPTVHGQRLPYLNQIMEQYFDVSKLLFVRLAMMTDNVLVPHRDFVEFDQDSPQPTVAHRLHVPLATTPDCQFMEEDLVYRMPFGGVWCLDASRIHSAAVLSTTQRVHLMLDFADVPEPESLLKFDVDSAAGIPPDCVLQRAPMTEADRAGILGLARVIDLDNLPQVFGIVTKKHFRKDGGEDFVWRALHEIKRRQGDPALTDRVDQLYTHYTLQRDE